MLVFAACTNPGETGPAGTDGTKGVDGTNGTNGTNGVDGATGAIGTMGADGEDAVEILIETTNVFENSFGCLQGYQVTEIGTDDGTENGTAGDGILQDGEIESVLTTCLAPDVDDDGLMNLDDGCALDADPTQLDSNFDGTGDACDNVSDTPLYWAITRGSDTKASDLYAYDPILNTATKIGNTGHGFSTIKVNPVDGLLYGITRLSDNGGCNHCLMTINTTTGAATTVIAITGNNGPTASMAFFADGSLYGVSEDGDRLVNIVMNTGVSTLIGAQLSTYGHGMCASAADDLLWINGDGQTFLLDTDPMSMVHKSLGVMGESLDDYNWIPTNAGSYGVRGDCVPDSLLYVGIDVTYGSAKSSIVFTRLYTDKAPTVQNVVLAPVDNFHYIAIDR